MIKKDITFENLDGESVTRTFYFNISKGELARYKLENNTGLEEMIVEMNRRKDPDTVIKTMEFFIDLAYGVRGEDGETFEKSPEATAAFKKHPAYQELFYTLVTDAVGAVEFLKGIFPKSIIEKLPENLNEESLQEYIKMAEQRMDDMPHPLTQPTVIVQELPSPKAKKLGDYTNEELLGLSDAEFDRLMKSAENPNNIPRNVLNVAFQRKFARDQR